MTNQNSFSKGNLKYIWLCICFSLGFAVVIWIGTLFNTSDTSLVFKNIDKSQMSNLLIALLFVAWMLESFLEILLKTFKLDVTKDRDRAEKPKSPTKSVEVARFTAIAGFIIGLIIAWSGVHTLGVFFSFDHMDNLNSMNNLNSGMVSDAVDNSQLVDSPDLVDSPERVNSPDAVDNPERQAKSIKEILFASVDAILTAGVIAGGSKGIHELTNTYKEFMQGIKERAA